MRRIGLTVLTVLLLVFSAAVPAPLVRDGEVLRGDFAQERMMEGFDAPLRGTGEFVLAPDRGVIWRVTDPFRVVTVITPDGLVQTHDGAVTNRLSADRMPQFGRLYGMLDKALRGDWRPFEERYHVSRIESGERWRVELRPRDDAADSTPFVSVVMAGARFAERVDIRRAGGNSDRLRFSNQTLSTGSLTPEESALLDSVEK